MPKGNPAGYAHKSGFGALGTNPKNIFAPGFQPPRGTTRPRGVAKPDRPPVGQPATAPPLTWDESVPDNLPVEPTLAEPLKSDRPQRPQPLPPTDGVDPAPRRPLPPRPHRPTPTGPTSAPGTRDPGTPLGPKFDPATLSDGDPRTSAYADSLQFHTPVQIADDLWVNLPVPSAEPSNEEITNALEFASYMESFYEQFLPQFASEAEARKNLGQPGEHIMRW